VSIIWARSVIRSNSALQSRGLGNTVVHSENGKFVVTTSAARSAGELAYLILETPDRFPSGDPYSNPARPSDGLCCITLTKTVVGAISSSMSVEEVGGVCWEAEFKLR